MKRALIYLGLVALLTGCFNTREVEPPQTTSSDWISPTDYQILLGNLKKAIADGNVQNYLRCFHQDSLRFTPSTPVYPQNQLLWDNWSWQDEQAYMTNLFGELGLTQGNYLRLEEVDLQNFSNDSLRYIGDYELLVNHTDTALTVNFQGQLEFGMYLNTYNEWEIRRWVDYETKADSSWSRLKMAYVQ